MTMKILFEFVSQFFEYEYFKLGILFVGHSVYVPLNEILFQGEWGGGGGGGGGCIIFVILYLYFL